MDNPETYDSIEPIAIIGMAGRFPKAGNLDEFWQNLRNGVECITFFTDEELAASGAEPALLNNPRYVRQGTVLEDIEMFDASFFGFSPREAEIMDPQHRFFLECVGINTYLLRNLISVPDFINSADMYQIAISNDKDFAPTRVSYKLNLKGPSVNINTACSSSLVAVQFACQSLLNYQCDMVMAGGVTIQVPQKKGYLYQEGGIPSPDGHCRAFDAKAEGTVFSSGAGIVLLKRLEDALEDGDCIHALIRGSAINNDGSLKAGYTAPGPDGQAEVIAEAQAIADVNPETITYIEAHGTGTKMGDPIEIAALTRAFRSGTQKKGFCAIGSVKTNIGHADTASGVAGLIKTVLSIKHKMILPSLNFEQPNPEIDFENSPFYVNAKLSEWKTHGKTPRRAGVSSFGIGGTNAHVVLEEFQRGERREANLFRPFQLLVLSAKTATALDAMTANLAEHLRQHPDLNLADAAYTLQVGRKTFNHRRILVCKDSEDAETALRTPNMERVLTKVQEPEYRPVVFMFSGQGAQYVNMGLELWQTEPTFQKEIDRCAEILKPHLGLDLRQELYEGEGREPGNGSSPLDSTAMAQPALFVIEYALAKLWMEWGVRPRAMIGHSIGEYVAACLAGVFSLEDALSLVAARGRIMGDLPEGSMLAVPLPEKEVMPLLGKELSLAAVNTPSLCVVSGQTDAVRALQDQLSLQSVECRPLHTSHAFHSEMMEPVVELFTEQVRRIRLNPPQIPYISNVTGTWITAEEATAPSYWAKHLRQTVRFADGIQELLKEPGHILLEIGPGRTLSTFAMRHPDRATEQVVLSSIRHPKDRQSDTAFLLTTLGRLWLSGVHADWSKFYAYEKRCRIPLPAYPFERERYWIDPPKQSAKTALQSSDRKPDIADWFYVPSWKRSPLPVSSLKLQTSGSWLIFLDECGLGDQLEKRLNQESQNITTVKSASGFSKLGDSAFAINVGESEDYDALFDELRNSDRLPKTIVHLWNVTEKWPDKPLSQYLELGFYSLLFLTQAIAKADYSKDIQLAVVSNHIHEVNGREPLCPEKAVSLGPVRVIPQEYLNISCRNIDIVFPDPESSLDKLTDQLLAEITSEFSETVIAFRGNYRWIQQFEPVRLENKKSGFPDRLREKRIWLITGGLGGMGLVLAAYLAENTQAKLILTGRSAFPGREAWESWLTTHSPDDAVSQKIQKVRELESSGAEVFPVCADVSDKQQMRAVFAQAEERFGRINGVIHAAGVPGGGMIQMKTRETAEDVFSPKVKGTRVLAAILKDVQPDFFILCSSLTSVTGGIGQIDYCAANAFLDAFAHSQASEKSGFTVSLNWDAWQEVGMAVAASKQLTSKFEISETDIQHPLFDKCLTEGTDRKIYISNFEVGKYWFLNEHRLMGKAVLPGTAYLEIARAAFEHHAAMGRNAERVIEIRDVFFLRPLIVEDDEKKEIRTVLEKQARGFEFSIISHCSDTQNEWQDHAKGKIAFTEDTSSEKYDLKKIENRCNRQEIIVTSEGSLKKKLTTLFGPRWDNLKHLKMGETEGLACLKLPDKFAEDTESYTLHPALLDIAAGWMALSDDQYEGLPFSYKRLRIKGPMPLKIFSHIRYAGGDLSDQETLKFDITITDGSGRKLVEIEEYTLRRIDSSAYRSPEPKGKTSLSPESENFFLEITSPGILDTLTFRSAPRQKPGPDEVEIDIFATGLNFKEVLYAMGLLVAPSDMRVKFGMECAGRIVQVGENVEDFSPGDEVISFAPASFSAFTTAPAALTARKPAHLSFEEAATIPVAFMTAYYSLIKISRLRKGERILIHAAAGGVGMAAVKIAQWTGAEIFATAGNPEKRNFLHSVGIQHVMNSRSLDFADEVMKLTGGNGVDVVLNSLSGEFIPKSLSVLARFGRFLELGVRDIYNNTPLGLRVFEKNLTFVAVGLSHDLPDFNAVFLEMTERFEQKDFTPLPVRVFPITEVSDAFEYMGGAVHIGKIVVSLQEKAAVLMSKLEKSAHGGRKNIPDFKTSKPIQNDFLKEGILPTEGSDVFRRILDYGEKRQRAFPQLLVSTRELQSRIEHHPHELLQTLEQAALPRPMHQRPDLSSTYVAPNSETEQILAEIWQGQLGIDQVGIYDNFFELGGDSLLGVQVISQLRDTFGKELTLGDLFEKPTVAGLAEIIVQKKIEEGDEEEMLRPGKSGTNAERRSEENT